MRWLHNEATHLTCEGIRSTAQCSATHLKAQCDPPHSAVRPTSQRSATHLTAQCDPPHSAVRPTSQRSATHLTAQCDPPHSAVRPTSQRSATHLTEELGLRLDLLVCLPVQPDKGGFLRLTHQGVSDMVEGEKGQSNAGHV